LFLRGKFLRVTDFFALIGLPRRPLVDERALQDGYLRRAAVWHPDAAGGDAEKFRELLEARRTLLDPAARLRHLLTLEGHDVRDGGLHGAPDLFLEVAGALDAVKGVCRRLSETRSAIGRAALESERRKAEQRVQRATEAVDAAWQQLGAQLQAQDARWPGADFALLENIGKKFVFLSRWQNELREALFRLKNPSAPTD
jgi:curved DNA-binding protein CbpA